MTMPALDTNKVVAVIGSGAMGSGIAQVAAASGYQVKLFDARLDAVDKAISLKGDYMEALVYKNLLLRLQANLEKNPARQQALLREADEFRNRAEELRKQKAAATAAPPPAAGRS